jgi:hypothetical protein
MQCLKLCGGSHVACVGALIASLMGSAYGATSTWVHDPATMGGWSDPNNWTPQPPGSSDIALIDNGGTAGIALAASMLGLQAGYSYAGSVFQLADDVTAGEVYLGYMQGAKGTYSLSGGSLTSPNEYVGFFGEGSLGESGGWNVVGGSVCLGYRVGSGGTYTLTAGRLDVGGREDVGVYGTGTFNQSGGTNAVGAIRLGYHTGSSGTYGLSGGSLATVGISSSATTGLAVSHSPVGRTSSEAGYIWEPTPAPRDPTS